MCTALTPATGKKYDIKRTKNDWLLITYAQLLWLATHIAQHNDTPNDWRLCRARVICTSHLLIDTEFAPHSPIRAPLLLHAHKFYSLPWFTSYPYGSITLHFCTAPKHTAHMRGAEPKNGTAFIWKRIRENTEIRTSPNCVKLTQIYARIIGPRSPEIHPYVAVHTHVSPLM